MKVAVVAENVSRSMSGEALLAFQFIQFMERRGVEVVLVCHQRVRDELVSLWPDSKLSNVRFVEESFLQRWLWALGSWLPFRIRDLVINQLLHLMTQMRARKIVAGLVHDRDIDVVFEPSPIAPKGVSCMYDVGAPVVIGPMCGGLDFPPAFRFMDSKLSRLMVGCGRMGSSFLHRIFPGKIRANALIVANCCTKKALPKGCRGKIYRVVESGVDLSCWDEPKNKKEPSSPTRFIFVGRLVDWKGVDFLVQAFTKVAQQSDAVLELVGDGELMPQVRQIVNDLGLQNRIRIHGWIDRAKLPELMRACDCLVAPSLRECGGIAMLEAMAIGLPLIGTKWAGPKDYISETCGILVDPESPEAFVEGLAQAMIRLDASPSLRDQMGEAARVHVRKNYFDWESKTDRIIEILQEVVIQHNPAWQGKSRNLDLEPESPNVQPVATLV